MAGSHRIPDNEAEEIIQRLEEPWVPPSGDYELVEADPAREKVIETLGIEESLVKPVQTTSGTTTASSPSSYSGLSLRKRLGLDQSDLRSQGKRSLDELRTTDGSGWWRPVRPTSRTVWPAREISMEWYKDNYNALYLRTKQFVEEYFGYNIIKQGIVGGKGPGGGSVWLGSPKTTRKYIALVARQDNNNPWGWDYLLGDRQLRQYVVSGIIARVFDKFIWQDLLFGATEAQREVLEKADRLTAELDGFPRTAIRSANIRALIGGDLVTPHFWEKVDELTFQLVTLLLPLIRLMDISFPRSREVSLRIVYQELYYLVFQAALLSLGIRWSQDIFRFSWPVLGSPFEMEQENVDYNVYRYSSDLAKEFDEKVDPSKQAEKETVGKSGSTPPADAKKPLFFHRLKSTAVELKDRIQNKIVSITMAGQDSVSVQARRDMIIPPDQLALQHRLAKVYIVTWPALFRHEVVGGMPNHPVTGYLDTKGERVIVIMKSPVVYYSGLEGPQGDYFERIPSLEEHVLLRSRERLWKTLRRWATVFTLLALGWVSLTLVAGWFFPSLGALIHNINYFVGGTIKMVVRQAALWVLTVVNNVVHFFVGGWKVSRFLSYAVRNQFADWGGYEHPDGGPIWPSTLPREQGWHGRAPLGTKYEIRYPRLDVETFQRLLHVIWGELRWNRYDSLSSALWQEPI